MRYTCIYKHWSSKHSEKYRHFIDKFWNQLKHIFRRNIDLSQTNFDKNSDTFLGIIYKFCRQIMKVIKTNFQNFSDKFCLNSDNLGEISTFCRQILKTIKVRQHFQENLKPSKFFSEPVWFFSICLEPCSWKSRKKMCVFFFNQNFENRASSCFKLAQIRPRAKMSWCWDFRWFRKTWTKFISSGFLTLDHMCHVLCKGTTCRQELILSW